MRQIYNIYTFDMCANEKKNLVGHPFFKLHTTLVADVETPYIDHLG